MHRSVISLIVWLAFSSIPAFAQDVPDLIVTLHAIDGAPLAGATVIVRDAGGDQNLARSTTDTQGQATFPRISATDIRVAIQGQLPNGTRYFQPGNDATGIALFLQQGTTRLNLLADVDGMIAPDPLTMAALEPGIPVTTAQAVVFPTAPLPPRPTVTAIAAVTRVAAARPGAAGGAAPTAAPVLGPGPIVIWLGAGLLVVLFGVGIGLIALMRRWR
jgi:hypothetical protein